MQTIRNQTETTVFVQWHKYKTVINSDITHYILWQKTAALYWQVPPNKTHNQGILKYTYKCQANVAVHQKLARTNVDTEHAHEGRDDGGVASTSREDADGGVAPRVAPPPCETLPPLAEWDCAERGAAIGPWDSTLPREWCEPAPAPTASGRGVTLDDRDESSSIILLSSSDEESVTFNASITLMHGLLQQSVPALNWLDCSVQNCAASHILPQPQPSHHRAHLWPQSAFLYSSTTVCTIPQDCFFSGWAFRCSTPTTWNSLPNIVTAAD